MSWRPGTRRTSLNPGNWLNSMDNIISFVSSGRLGMKRIWLGGCSGMALGMDGADDAGAGGAGGAITGGAGLDFVGGGPEGASLAAAALDLFFFFPPSSSTGFGSLTVVVP